MAKSPKTKLSAVVEPAAEPELTRLSGISWWASCAGVMAVAAFFRCYHLSLKPFHHDEGVNGFFMTKLVRQGIYEYNPHDYHGPTLYFFTLVSTFIFGLNNISLRMVPVVFGLATIFLVFCLRRYLGAAGALSAGLLLAVSPGAIYISRYFIHESLFVFFTLAIVVALLRWYATTNVIYLIGAAVSVALLFATKETAFISIGVLIIAGLLVAGMQYIEETRGAKRKPGFVTWARASVNDTVERCGGTTGLLVQLFSAVSALIIVYVLFYSSFFTHKPGVWDSFAAFKLWGKTGTTDHTTNGWYAYFWWLRASESPLFILGGLGAAVAVWVRKNRFALFVCLWAWGITAAYTLIPYKTPWLALNFVIPLALASGVTIDWLVHGENNWDGRIMAALFLAGAVGLCTYEAIQLNFYHYDDDSYPYVYAHSKRDLLRLVDDIDRFAKRSGQGAETSVIITSPDHWPLPWYLRDYPRVGYYGQMTPPGNAEMVLGRSDQREELDSTLFGRYKLLSHYDLRPGVILLLYVRSDLVQPGDLETAPIP